MSLRIGGIGGAAWRIEARIDWIQIRSSPGLVPMAMRAVEGEF
jgi:hypothetical protein